MPRKNAPPRTTSEGEKEFRVVQASTLVSIAPIFATDPRAGVDELLDSMIMRYVTPFCFNEIDFILSDLDTYRHFKGLC
jgi:hypothetical protein